ncbi:uncharacterized protein LOC142524640 [Primulina tabacum]|uniref:uncharacterized protein LOC142524640 n=1 Tax=Primulina tabacum TaxID=48773 RepID=UPI003F5AC9D8
MSVANLCTSENLNAMKSDEGNDSLENFIRQAVGKEPVLPFSRTGDSPVQWIQLLHSLEQPDLPGWPLLTPVKVQMQKCEKCSREFCSSVNYRRHIRVHRRSLNVDKESHKNRNLLAAFWDKLSLKESMEIVSLSDVMLKDIPGSSIIRALASSIRKSGLWTLPPVYVKAGSALLDIIHAKPPRLPISSQELFSILDNASERTFLCAGTADSVQKYVFDVEAAKNSLELKNLVACTGFLFELQLVKAWVADKDAEALRCHKLLVEEEEAAQKRQAELLERKKQKKLRQKEQKFKEHLYEGNIYMNVTVDAVDGPLLAEASATPSPSDSDSNSPNADKFIQSYLDSLQNRSKEETDTEAQLNFNTEHIILDDFQIIEPSAYDHQHVAINNWQVLKSHKAGWNGFGFRKNLQALKPEATQKLRPSKGQVLVNGNKVWTRKIKPNSAGESLKATLPREVSSQIADTKSEVMIGSISVALKVCEWIDTPSMEHVGELTEADSVRSGTKGEPISTSPVQSGKEESDEMFSMSSMNDRFSSSERCVPSHSPDDDDDDEDDDRDSGKDVSLLSGETPQQERAPFSSITAKEFLALRWKKAVSADHVRLVLSSGSETPGNSDKVATQASVLGEINVLGNVENRLGGYSHVMSRTKLEKSLRIK